MFRHVFLLAISLLIFQIQDNLLATTMEIDLPQIAIPKGKPLGQILQERYSCRNFKSDKSLKNTELSLILWAAGGLRIDAVTEATRTVPSAGACYPLEFYIVIGKNSVEEIVAGVYHYEVFSHRLKLIKPGDIRKELVKSCLGQTFIEEAPIAIVIAAEYKRTTWRYSEKGIRYVHMDAGHSCQNIYLMASDLGLATVEVGAFQEAVVSKVLGLKSDIKPLAIMPVGYPK